MMTLHERIAAIAEHCETILSHFQVKGILEWSCIFCQNEQEFTHYKIDAYMIGELLEFTPTGPVLRLRSAILFPQGKIYFIKIRRPDPTRPELGDCDYAALPDWQTAFNSTQGKPGFSLIEREKFKMIELKTPGTPARVYFSNPTLGQEHGISA